VDFFVFYLCPAERIHQFDEIWKNPSCIRSVLFLAVI
jgi:hypothetical protein